MQTQDESPTTFGRELATNLGLQVAGGAAQLVLLLLPAAIGYVSRGAVGLLIGLAGGAALIAVFWVVVVVLGLGGLGQRLRGR